MVVSVYSHFHSTHRAFCCSLSLVIYLALGVPSAVELVYGPYFVLVHSKVVIYVPYLVKFWILISLFGLAITNGLENSCSGCWLSFHGDSRARYSQMEPIPLPVEHVAV